MTYIFIESRDPFESHDTQFVEETATAFPWVSNSEVRVFQDDFSTAGECLRWSDKKNRD